MKKNSDTDDEIRKLMALCFRAGAFAQFVSSKQRTYLTPQHAAETMPWEEMRTLVKLIPNDGIVPEPALLFNEEELPAGDFWITLLELAYTMQHWTDAAAETEWKRHTKNLLEDWYEQMKLRYTSL